MLIDSTTTVDEWQELSAELVVPAGTLQVQIGVEIVVGNNPVGALYFDDLQMSYSGGMAHQSIELLFDGGILLLINNYDTSIDKKIPFSNS